MKIGRRIKHKPTFAELLAREARSLKEQADKADGGLDRDLIMQKLRQLETALHTGRMDEVAGATAAGITGNLMDGKILNSDGQFVAYIKADVIYDLAGRRLYALRGEKIYKPTGELIGHLNFINGAGWLNKTSERLFSTA